MPEFHVRTSINPIRKAVRKNIPGTVLVDESADLRRRGHHSLKLLMTTL